MVVVGHSHDHHRHRDAGARAGARHASRLRWALALNLALFLAEVATAFVAHSLALFSEAVHVLTDALGVGMALAAVGLADRVPREGSRTFGLYRLEILAALANALLLLGAVAYLLVEAVLRVRGEPTVYGGPVLVIGAVGVTANLAGFALLRAGARESLAIESAYLDMAADVVGSLGVVLAGVVVLTTGWTRADPIVAGCIALWILPRAWALAGRSVRILIQAAPAHVDVHALQGDLEALPGVVDVHDLHVWTLTSEMDVVSAHLMVASRVETHSVLDRARVLLHDRYDIAHATLQVEPDDHTGCEELNW